MANYGFTVNADGNVIDIMNKMQAAIAGMGGTVTQTTDKVRSSFNKMSSDASKSLGDISKSIKNVVSGLLAFESVKGFLKLGVDAEQTAISFEVFLGSAKKADEMVSKLRNFAKVTPFESTDVNDAAKMLLNFGTAAEDILPTLQMLGDASGGNAQRFSQMTYAFAQIQSTGKLTGQDLMQLINAGFNPLQEISKRTGIAMKDLKATMSDGGISAKMVTEAFKSATSQGGQFYGMMEKQSQSIGGKWSTLVDEFKGKLLELFERLAPTLSQVLDGIAQMAPAFSSLMNSIATAFTSAPIQFFLLHIKDVLGIVMKLVPIWISYKTAMVAVNTVQSIQAAITQKLIPLFRQQTTALEGSTAAAGAFKAQIISTGIGAFAVAIGFLIEKLSAMNDEFMESIEKISHIKELAAKDTGMKSEFEKVQSIYQAGVSELNKEQRTELYERILALVDANKNAIAMEIKPAISNIDKRMEEIPDIQTNSKRLNKQTGVWEPIVNYTKEEKKLQENRASLEKSQMNYLNANIALLKMAINLDAIGVKRRGAGGGGNFGGFSDVKNAINTSSLAGAKGGLGEAKVVNIHIDTMQKVVTSDNRQLKEKGKDAVEVMLRTVNNISYSASSTQ